MKNQQSIIESIKSKWKLPDIYLDFLVNHLEKMCISINDDDELSSFMTEEITVYGANGFIRGQDGYSYNSVLKEPIKDWNPDFVVIANCNADPYCIDISLENSPVYFVNHGTGKWNFREEYKSLTDFLSDLGLT